MNVSYMYKDKEFCDIREIVNNNKLEINYEYIFEEYIPFQLFITRTTPFKDVCIHLDYGYSMRDQLENVSFDYSIFKESIDDYLNTHKYDLNKITVAAVSGGVDSSIIALELYPDIIYSGYYDKEGYDETPESSIIADKLKACHYKIKLSEHDFLVNYEEFMREVCIPIGGLGSIMEYATLKEFRKLNNLDFQLFFGNGGDEIFMGYYFNHYIMNLYEDAHKGSQYMSNFNKTRIFIFNNIVDHLILSSLLRMNDVTNSTLQHTLFHYLVDRFREVKSIGLMDKLLSININNILPGLLHLNNQMCRKFNIKSFNPLSNDKLIKISKAINTPFSFVPKIKLREIRDSLGDNAALSDIIKNNHIKKGFPIPFDDWKEVDKLFKEYYDSFFKRNMNHPLFKKIKDTKYDKINRYTWGIFQAESFLRTFG